MAEVFSTHFAGQRKAAFTLAEVLITLGIIGVVAAMTLPALIKNYQHKVLESQFKKKYSVLSQVASQVKFEFSDCDTLYTDDIKEFMSKRFSAAQSKKIVQGTTTDILFKNYKQYTFTGVEADTRLHMNCLVGNNNWTTNWGPCHQMVLNDGSFVGLCSHNHNATSYHPTNGTFITVDVNGYKGPNRFGHDIWGFHLDGKTCKVTATGTHRNFRPDESGYGIGASASFDEKCSLTDMSSNYNGFYCAYYAIINKCPDGSEKSYWNCLPK